MPVSPVLVISLFIVILTKLLNFCHVIAKSP